jgi:hypothetical protein
MQKEEGFSTHLVLIFNGSGGREKTALKDGGLDLLRRVCRDVAKGERERRGGRGGRRGKKERLSFIIPVNQRQKSNTEIIHERPQRRPRGARRNRAEEKGEERQNARER